MGRDLSLFYECSVHDRNTQQMSCQPIAGHHTQFRVHIALTGMFLENWQETRDLDKTDVELHTPVTGTWRSNLRPCSCEAPTIPAVLQADVWY